MPVTFYFLRLQWVTVILVLVPAAPRRRARRAGAFVLSVFLRHTLPCRSIAGSSRPRSSPLSQFHQLLHHRYLKCGIVATSCSTIYSPLAFRLDKFPPCST